MDLPAVDPDPNPERGAYQFRRARLGLQGNFFRDFEYEVEYDFARVQHGLRDAYVNYRRFSGLQVQAGRFKLPFGRDQLQSPANLNFVYRSRLGAQIAPGRQTGLMLHGPLFGRVVRYQVGLFHHDGENSYGLFDRPAGGRTAALRVRSEPARYLPLPKLLENLELGAAFTRGNVEEGRNSLRGRTAFGLDFSPRFAVGGPRQRLGTEAHWSPGPFFLQGEYMQVREGRAGQGVRLDDLPDLIGRGWYVAGAWLVTGEKKASGNIPRRPLFQGGFGAVELAARQEFLRFASAGAGSPQSLSPRAQNTYSSSDRASTFGVNWYLSRYVKVQANFIREKVESPYSDWLAPWRTYWTRVVRIQFTL